jgi:replicative DNA helicase
VPHESITVRRVEEAAASAARRGATLLVIDHLDRIEVGDKDEFQGTRFLARRLTDLAQMHNLVIVAFSQLNLQAHAGNRLAVYAPPRLVAMRGGGSKAEEAAVVLGIYRPKRGRMLGETADEWTNVLRAVKAGDRPVTDAISRDMMGIVVMKHRYGIEGAPAFLRYDKGRLTEWAPTLAPRPGVV